MNRLASASSLHINPRILYRFVDEILNTSLTLIFHLMILVLLRSLTIISMVLGGGQLIKLNYRFINPLLFLIDGVVNLRNRLEYPF